jgi:hypothetical protein
VAIRAAIERTASSGVTRKSKEENMDENRIAGSAKKLGGQVQEEFGRVTAHFTGQLYSPHQHQHNDDYED